jgi:hypothetical protein
MPSPNHRTERLICPDHFQKRVARAGGLNRYGTPNFKLAWAQTETTRQGGRWEAHGEWYTGYRDILLGDGLPHWMLLQWADAGKSIQMPHCAPESDGAWYEANKCNATGLSLLGGYPYQGSYQIALPLRAKWVERDAKGNPSMRIHAFPLSTEIIDMMIPIIKATRELSIQVKLASMEDDKKKDDETYSLKVEEAYNDSRLSAAARSSKWIADRQRQMEKTYNAALIMHMNKNRVFQSSQRMRG